MEEYLEYLRTFWEYFPYMLYTFVFLTLVPKSLGKIKSFADADYAANRHKYHRCYGPDLCCHALSDEEALSKKPKQRKAVTRVYPKKHDSTNGTHALSTPPQRRRQVQASAIQTQTNVNEIAKMFENGVGSKSANRKINRVTPTILPEIRMHGAERRSSESMEEFEAPTIVRRKTITATTAGNTSQLTQLLLKENIENSVNLLNQANADLNALHWHSAEPLRRTRPAPPNSLTFAGTSATPSTASPAASSPQSSPLSSPLASPVMRSPPKLHLQSSLENIFAAIAHSAEKNDNFLYAGCNSLSPVTSIDDILSQRRLSRPLSAYSISDLLKDDATSNAAEEVYVENFLRNQDLMSAH